MGKKKEKIFTDEQKQLISDCGRTNFDLKDMCLLANISLDDFAESTELQNLYRTAQLRTQLEIRKKLVDDAVKDGSIKSIKLFLEYFHSATLPDLEEMTEDE